MADSHSNAITPPLRAHPAAELFPLMADTDLAELAEDIKKNGLHEPVWLVDHEGETVILDGRNRHRACEMAGIEPKTRRYAGEDPIGFSISQNVQRRHLTPGQKAAVAYNVLPLYEEEARRAKARAAAVENRRRAQERAAEKAQAEPPLADSCSPMWADLPTSGEARERIAEELADLTDQQNEVCPDVADLPHPDQPEEAPPRPQPRMKVEPKRAPLARDKAAAAVGASGRGVAQYARLRREAPDLAAKVDGGMALDRADRILRDREAERRRIEQAKAEAEAAAQGETFTVDIRHGDFREVLSDLSGVDAIITDPPYPGEFIPLMADLRDLADRILKPDGILAVLMGQTHLPEVYRLLDGGRPYRWTAAYLTPGNGYVSMGRKVQSNWKPLIVYGGKHPRFADVFESKGSDADAKNNHKWGQDYGAFHSIVERLTSRGQTVVDPFMGAGTTLLAAHALGRHAIGCDIDPEHVQRTRERLA